MSEQPAPARRAGSLNLMRARLNGLSSSRSRSVLGPAEIIGLALSLLILVLVIGAYLYFLVPARSRRDRLQLEYSRLQSQLKNSQDLVRQGQTTEATVQSITESLDAFEHKQLLSPNHGRMSLYDTLNQLIRKNGLRNTSGPTYSPLEAAGSKAGTVTRAANAKWQSIYPGIAISLTVEGPYQNLRRFIRELETNKQFVIINSVELERATETNSPPPVEGAPAGEARGPSNVSLRLDMATYFQRNSPEDPAIEPAAH